jgi:8-oxo-dGTP pyrophosphatase MutT (NUDIX family)
LLSFDPKQEPAVPRHASTVVVVRERASGLEVFCVLRHARSSFLGGAVVFPGGKVDASDGAADWEAQATAPHPRAHLLTPPFTAGAPPVTARALAVAACRETLEEARILPLDGPCPDAEAAALQAELLAAPGTLAAALARRGRRLALDALVPWARWVTPEAEARRFDARFYLLALPAGQEGRHDEHETTQSFWARPAAVLDRAGRGEIFLAPPTTRTLEHLATVDSAAGAWALAAEQALLPVCPAFVPADAPFLALPGDPAHPLPERRLAGPTRFVLRDGRFVSEDPPGGAAKIS